MKITYFLLLILSLNGFSLAVRAAVPAGVAVPVRAPVSDYGQHFETNDISQILKLVDKQTIVIFDIDHTIFRSKTLFGSPEWAETLIKQEMSKGTSRQMSSKKVYPLWMKAQKFCDLVLLDNKFIKILQDVKKRAYGFIALTSRQPMAAEITTWQLHKFGIDFGRSSLSPLFFISSQQYPALYREGILFAHDFNRKGEVFFHWMEQIRAQINRKNAIKRVVFIDDKIKNLQSMAAAAQHLGLEFIGVRYSAGDAFKRKIDPMLVEKEREILSNNLSDSETWLFLENAGSYKGGEEGID